MEISCWEVHKWKKLGDYWCRGLYIRILPLPCERIFSLKNLIVNNKENFFFLKKSALHSDNTRNKHHSVTPTTQLPCFQKITYGAGIKIFNNLPCRFNSWMNEKAQFMADLCRYINMNF
jgi:hypothetical protein